MRVAMFSNTFLPMLGGIENSVDTFAEDFRRQGHRCLVVTPEMTGAEESTDEIMRVPALKNVGGSAFSLQLPVPGFMTARMDDFAPDIVHSHHPFLMGDSALRTAWRLNVPLVLTYHTLWDRYADFFPNETCKNIVVNLSVEYANACDCVVAPSRSLADMIAGLGVTSPIEVVPTGIDLALFGGGDRARGRLALGLPADARVAGYVGRVGPEKNLAWLCGAAARWCAGDASARFTVVGPSESYGGVLKKVFEDAGLGDRLLLPGTFRGCELADAYAALDVFAFASHSDTQGIVLAEAMAAGLPIVALDAPGAREAVVDGANGFLLPADSDAGVYADALGRVFADAACHEGMRVSARRRAQAYDRRQTARRMLELYRSLAANPVAAKAGRGGTRAYERVIGRLEAEWKLLATKASATLNAVADSRRE